ncbi:LAQU0S01e06810g1_1 [Lachancea quebecensis]|uniref:Histone H1 n=1 Tax=Lachancea quebecensis TaxID=1654605 RepID=A0A0P1KLY5_9SACH|nr:LAQU0S01e06810g1_1 [Lachancea quebecensis]
MPSRVETKVKQTRSNSAVSAAKQKETTKSTVKNAKPVNKKVTKPSAKPKPPLPTYKDMIAEGIAALGERNGSSRQALKKYISAKYPVGEGFENRFNLAIRRGIDSGDFSQPKGSSGPLKVVKKGFAKPEHVNTPKTEVGEETPKRRKSTAKAKDNVVDASPSKAKRKGPTTAAPKTKPQTSKGTKKAVSTKTPIAKPVKTAASRIKAA